jgi:phosphoglycolate phosphatase
VSTKAFPDLVLFDLDGTLLDSAPDFVATIDVLCAERNHPSLPAALLRPHVSRGARAMVTAAFPDIGEAAVQALIPRFLEVYAGNWPGTGRHSTASRPCLARSNPLVAGGES